MLEKTLQTFLSAAAKRLRSPLPPFTLKAKKNGAFELRTQPRQVTLIQPAAVVSMLVRIFQTPKVRESVCVVPGGRWPTAASLVRLDGAPRTSWLALVSELHEHGHREQARLAWLWSRCGDDDPLEGVLFPKLPAPARIDEARSATALLERKLKWAGSKSVEDQLVVALDVLEFVDPAMTDLLAGSPRRMRFVAQVDAALAKLTQSRSPAVRDATRLARQEHARCEALWTE